MPQMNGSFKNISPSARRASLFLLVFLIAITVYSNSLFNGFVHDDLFQVLGNPWIRNFKNIPAIFKTGVWGFFANSSSNYYRPVMHLIYMADYYLFGLNPAGFHLTNIIFHSANCLLVFLVTEKILTNSLKTSLLTGKSVPLITAVIFAIHPIHTESVAWVAGIPDLSFTLFFLLSFYLFLASSREDSSTGGWRIILSAFLYFIAMLCKEPAATLPLFLLGYDLSRKKTGLNLIEYFKKYLPYIIAFNAYLFLRYSALGALTSNQKPFHDLSAHQAFINAFPLFLDYLIKLALPYNLNAYYTFHPVSNGYKIILPAIIATGYLVALIVAFRKQPIIFLGLLLIAIPLLPSLYIPAIGKNVFAERYLYLSVFGFGLLLAFFLSRVTERRRGLLKPIAFCLVLLAIFYSTETFIRNRVWKDNFALWSDTIKKSPDSADAHNNLGILYMEASQLDAAEIHFTKAIEIEPLNIQAHGNLGIIHDKKGELQEAVNEFQFVLDVAPDSFVAHYNLGLLYSRLFRVDDAVREFTKVTEIAPLYSEAYSNLGIIYAKTGRIKEAVKELQTAIKLNPDDAASRECLKAIGMK